MRLAGKGASWELERLSEWVWGFTGLREGGSQVQEHTAACVEKVFWKDRGLNTTGINTP